MKNDIIRKILLLAVGLALILLLGCSEQKVEGGAVSLPEPSFETILTGSTEAGDVAIELTPLNFHEGLFEVALQANTHSVDLSQYPLGDITFLEYDGKKLRPMSAPKLSGHHASGTFVFALDEQIKQFQITITGIPDVKKRLFSWE